MKTAFRFSSGSAEALKWLALTAMTLDHVNTFALDRAHPALYVIGRVAFPLFAIVLASNLARPGIDLARISARLLAFGAIAAVPFLMLRHAFPLNVMFTFAAATLAIAAWQAGHRSASIAAIAIAGLVVDYHWPGLLLIVSAWAYFRAGTRTAAAMTFAALVALAWPNGNLWALAALPVALAIEAIAPHVPRLRWAFYAYYPAHLALLALLA